MFEIFEEKRPLRMLQHTSATKRNCSLRWIFSSHGRIAFKIKLWEKHLQLMQMIQEIQRQSAPKPWAPGWSSGQHNLRIFLSSQLQKHDLNLSKHLLRAWAVHQSMHHSHLKREQNRVRRTRRTSSESLSQHSRMPRRARNLEEKT